ncbi:hypothetical protein QX776_00445 [Alteromonadaceae bacterium BrNp21-10]|nr:hypothetical protein [Alteromonadaceae bacterium BrNp21-10]
MKKTTKAVLFSALVFPGSGHFILGRMKTAWVLLITSLVAIFNLGSTLLATAQTIADKIIAGEISPTIEAISRMVEQQPVDTSSQLMSMIILVCWVIGIIDSYRCGRPNEVSADQQSHR